MDSLFAQVSVYVIVFSYSFEQIIIYIIAHQNICMLPHHYTVSQS